MQKSSYLVHNTHFHLIVVKYRKKIAAQGSDK